MNIIKKTLLGILVLFLTGLIILLTLSADLKNVIVNGVVMEIVKYQITNINYKAGNKEQNTIFEYTTDDEKVNEILESKEIQELVSKYVDITIKSMTDEESIDQIDIEQDMINYIKENKKVIEEKTGVQISDEMIEQTKEEIEAQEINENVKIALKETKKNLTDSQKKTLKGYGLVTSTKLKVFLLVLIIIDSIFIFLLQRKDNKWIYVLGNACFSAGIGIIIMCIIVKVIVSRMSNIPLLNLSILIKHGLIELICGLLVMIMYKIVIKMINQKKGKNIDEVSENAQFTEL